MLTGGGGGGGKDERKREKDMEGCGGCSGE